MLCTSLDTFRDAVRLNYRIDDDHEDKCNRSCSILHRKASERLDNQNPFEEKNGVILEVSKLFSKDRITDAITRKDQNPLRIETDAMGSFIQFDWKVLTLIHS
jgi:hypothetical protein